MTTRIGVYPGSFNPPTWAHLEIAVAALTAHQLDRLDLAVSTVALGKGEIARPTFDERLDVIRSSVLDFAGIEVVITSAQLIADIAAGYDVVVMGADKWAQVNEPSWYGDDPTERDAAIAALPTLALAPRPPHPIPDHHRLMVPDDLLEISSTAAREGRLDYMTPAAQAFNARTHAWHRPKQGQTPPAFEG
ncbi:MAG: hypothetical protein ACI9C1_001104 [Candidatus Aldehydirespiratoraceae bacterium]